MDGTTWNLAFTYDAQNQIKVTKHQLVSQLKSDLNVQIPCAIQDTEQAILGVSTIIFSCQ